MADKPKLFHTGMAIKPVDADPSAPIEGQLQMSDGTHRSAGLWQYISAAWNQLTALLPTTTKGDLIVHNGTTDIRVGVGSDGQHLVADSGEASGVKWEDPNWPGATYETSSTPTMSHNTTTIVDYNTSIYDTDTAVTTGASWKFTAPSGQGGKYLVTAAASLSQGDLFSGNEIAQLQIFKNGSLHRELFATHGEGVTAGEELHLSGSAIVSLAASDYIDIRVFHNAGASMDLGSSAAKNYVSIQKLRD